MEQRLAQPEVSRMEKELSGVGVLMVVRCVGACKRPAATPCKQSSTSSAQPRRAPPATNNTPTTPGTQTAMSGDVETLLKKLLHDSEEHQRFSPTPSPPHSTTNQDIIRRAYTPQGAPPAHWQVYGVRCDGAGLNLDYARRERERESVLGEARRRSKPSSDIDTVPTTP